MIIKDLNQREIALFAINVPPDYGYIWPHTIRGLYILSISSFSSCDILYVMNNVTCDFYLGILSLFKEIPRSSLSARIIVSPLKVKLGQSRKFRKFVPPELTNKVDVWPLWSSVFSMRSALNIHRSRISRGGATPRESHFTL